MLSSFKRYIPRLPFDTNRIKGGMLGKNLLFILLIDLFNIIEVKNVMTSIAEDTFTKPPHLSMEEYDVQVFRTSTKR